MTSKSAHEEILEIVGNRSVLQMNGDKVTVTRPFMDEEHRWLDINVADYRRVYLEHTQVCVHEGDDLISLLHIQERLKEKNKSHFYWAYKLGLEGEGGRLDLGEVEGDHHAAAESVAKFLGLAMVDRSQGEQSVHREVGTLDDSIRQQASKSGTQLSLPTRPTAPKANFEFEGQTATFVIPGGKPDSEMQSLVAKLIFGTGALAAFIFLFLHWVLSAIVVVGTIVVWQLCLNAIATQWAIPITLKVSPEELRLQTGNGLEQSFAAAEIEELKATDVPMNDVMMGLHVKTDRTPGHLQLRAGKPTNTWMVDTARYILSQDPENIDWDTLRSWS